MFVLFKNINIQNVSCLNSMGDLAVWLTDVPYFLTNKLISNFD